MLMHGGAGAAVSPRQVERRRAVLVLLASRSPRRRELLTEHGIEHVVVSSGVDDTHLEPGRVEPAQWAMALAHLKAAGAARSIDVQRETAGHPDRKVIVLGADTVVVKNGRVLPAPTTAEVAREIVRSLRRGEHSVITGVCLLDPATGDRRLFADEARVHVGEVSDDEIERYIASGGWAGKAGAYNIAERRAAGWPITHAADETTIVGLPMARLHAALDSLA
jgi:septum formation protein